ncbi:MAG: HAD family phosphatase [Candidatus Omnitrophica bacterium]|nr:HAD family phosphatase [Candidatus Omnitrophota bacterium]MBU1047593.1 HAD family phosphatase [Candidatus Omnitrophota bacterium]MBU1631372.1 HAD family phosphatase [Candidatus Omnitrophota bacterium]MBU1888955.1 HAD family phosphatase [Candidatus Omnitrophota bacterium]
MIKAIILDWGGVLIDNPVAGFMTYCSQYLKVPKKTFIETTSKFYEDFAKGKVTENAFWKNVCSYLNVAVPSVSSLLTEAFRAVYSEKKEVFSIVSSLKDKGYKIALLSNTEMPMVNFFREKNYSFFDLTVFSCVEGVIKPDKKIYEITLDRLKIKPQEAVFIDDKEENILSGKDVGINAILFKNPQQFKKELLSLL